ncbi:MAG TPA: DNA repair exonuclease [Kofleriaceae bacterium]|nr:DNA repair exonuclease [Kofleriaceae bacterium]
MALKILHTADWHLGMQFRGFDDDCRLRLTRARLSVVKRLLDLAERYAVNAVLCAGDLFDDPTPEQEWWEGLANLFQERHWSDRPVFLLPGNHDPITSKSVYGAEHAFRHALPPWVHVVDRDDFSYEISPDAVLYACPCRSLAGDRDLALALPDRQPGDPRIRIGLAHGSTFDIPGCQTNFPIARDAVEQRGLNYLAVGDTHSFREVPPGARMPTVYPSAPEQTNFGEEDAGYAALVFFRRSGGRPAIHRERVGQWSWREAHVTSLDELRRLATDDGLRQTVLRLTLELRVSLAEYDEAQRLIRELKGSSAAHGRVGVLQLDDQKLEVDTSQLGDLKASLPPVLAAVVDRLEQAQADDPQVAQRALYHLYRLVREGGRRATG